MASGKVVRYFLETTNTGDPRSDNGVVTEKKGDNMVFKEFTKEQHGIVERAFAKAKSSMRVPEEGRVEKIEYQGFIIRAINRTLAIEIEVTTKTHSMMMSVVKVYYKGHTATAKNAKDALQKALQLASNRVYQKAKEHNFALFP